MPPILHRDLAGLTRISVLLPSLSQKFVGRVKRTLIGEHKLPNCTTNGQGSTEQQRAETEGAEGEGRSQHVVITLDEVLVYRREGLPIGSAMPRVNQEHFITAWDVEDGIPTGHTRLLSQKDVGKSRAVLHEL